MMRCRITTLCSIAAGIVAVALGGCAGKPTGIWPAGTEAPVALTESWRSLASDDLRALAAAERIGHVAALLCADGGQTGLAVAHLPEGPSMAARAARAAYGADAGGVVVTAVLSGGAAERAGVRRGLVVARIGGVTLASDAVEDAWGALAGVRRDIPIDLVSRDGTAYRIEPDPGCPFPVVVDTAAGLAASTSADRIRITSALVRFAAAAGELETIIAHEAAHMLLCHHRRARPVAEREAAADRLSARLLHAAGIDIAVVDGFWRRFGARRGLLDLVDISHGSAGQRRARMREAYAEAEAGAPLTLEDSDCPAAG